MDNRTIYQGHVHDGRHSMRAVIFWDACAYFASCVEKDIGAQGPTPEEALRRLREAARLDEMARWESWEKTGDLVELPPAPREIRVLWRKNNPTIQ